MPNDPLGGLHNNAETIFDLLIENSGEEHWTAVKNILKYLRNTKDMFLVYRGNMERELRVSCYTDTGYLTDADNLKSQTGYVFVLNGGVVDWKITKHSIFATSSTDAEYIAAFDASKEVVWINKFISGLGIVPTIEEPISMYSDNTGATAMAKDDGVTKGARYFRPKVHYLRETIKLGDVKIEKIDTDDNLVDLFTKVLAFPKHSELTRNIGLLPASSFIKNGIVQHLTSPYTPQQNGVSERRNRTLLDMVRSMFNLTTLPLSFWDYALESAVRILNMVPTKKLDKTPYEIWHGKAPNLSYLKVWGCEAYVKRDSADKLHQRSVKCIFVGYPKETMGYYFYFPPENKVIVARYVNFFERDLISQKFSGRENDLEDDHMDTLPSENTSEILVESKSLGSPPELIPVRRFFSQKGSGVGRGIKEKSLNMSKTNTDIGLSTTSDGTRNEVTTSAGNAPGKSSYANITSKPSGKKVNVRIFYTPGGNGIDVVVSVDSIRAISERFANTTYGFFLGKKVAYPVVANYEDVSTVPLWVKLHGVPVIAFSEDGLSAISTKLGTPLMLDSYTSDMCMQSWCRLSYARIMIELRADVELEDNIVMAMPKIARERHYTFNVRVEYEWKPPRCSSCKVFGHIHEECSKNTGAGEKKTMKKPSQTYQGVSVGSKMGFKAQKEYRHVPKKPTTSSSGNKKKGVEPTIEVSNLNPFDVFNSVDNDVEFGTNERTTNLINNRTTSSGSSFMNVDNSSVGTTPIIDKIGKFEDLLGSGQAILVDKVGNPLKKVEFSGEYDSKDEVESVYNDMAHSMASEWVGSQIPDNSKKGLGFESYHVVPPPLTGEDIPNKVKESPAAPLVKDKVSDSKDCTVESLVVIKKKTVVPTIAKVEFVRANQQEKPVRKPVKYAEMYRTRAFNTARPKAVNTARPRAVNTARPRVVNTARPRLVNTARPNSAIVNVVMAIAKVKTVNGDEQIQALVDKKKVIIT
nr:retrotransposon protein, putative, Ty1-copia subclass [Tanacetum cinerariifolium]